MLFQFLYSSILPNPIFFIPLRSPRPLLFLCIDPMSICDNHSHSSLCVSLFSCVIPSHSHFPYLSQLLFCSHPMSVCLLQSFPLFPICVSIVSLVFPCSSVFHFSPVSIPPHSHLHHLSSPTPALYTPNVYLTIIPTFPSVFPISPVSIPYFPVFLTFPYFFLPKPLFLFAPNVCLSIIPTFPPVFPFSPVSILHFPIFLTFPSPTPVLYALNVCL